MLSDADDDAVQPVQPSALQPKGRANKPLPSPHAQAANQQRPTGRPAALAEEDETQAFRFQAMYEGKGGGTPAIDLPEGTWGRQQPGKQSIIHLSALQVQHGAVRSQCKGHLQLDLTLWGGGGRGLGREAQVFMLHELHQHVALIMPFASCSQSLVANLSAMSYHTNYQHLPACVILTPASILTANQLVINDNIITDYFPDKPLWPKHLSHTQSTTYPPARPFSVLSKLPPLQCQPRSMPACLFLHPCVQHLQPRHKRKTQRRTLKWT